MQTLRTAGLLCLTIASFLGACGEQPPTGTDGILSIQKAASNNGDQQTDTVFATLAPFRVLVKRGMTPAQGVSVSWTPTDSDAPPSQSTTDAAGIASVTLTFDSVPRTYTVRASVDGAAGSPATFTATATPATATSGNALGTLELKTTTTGVDLPNGYVVRLHGASFDGASLDTLAFVSANATTAIRLRPGGYTVTLRSVAVNCGKITPGSIAFTVPIGGSAPAAFDVTCEAAMVLAFVSATDAEIYTIKSNGTAATRLTTGGGNTPAWSPDGSQIAFTSNRDGTFGIYVMNADGSGQTRLTNDPGWSRQPGLSWDGTKIAFSRLTFFECYESGSEGGFRGCISKSALYVMNADGSGATTVGSDWTPSHFFDVAYVDPTWSPDGRWIAVSYTLCDPVYAGCYYDSVIRLVLADGGGAIDLGHNGSQLAWRP